MEVENDEDEVCENHITLTDEFKDSRVQPCSIVELLTLFKKSESNRNKNFEENNIVKQTRNYVFTFNKYGIPEDPTSKACRARSIFSNAKGLNNFEITQLIDLVPEKAEEAMSLIPTLKDKLSIEELNSYLEELNKESEK